MNLELNFHKIENYRNLILDCIWRHEFEKVINNLGLFSLKMGEKTTYFPIFIELNVSWQPLIIIEEEDILLCLDTENHFVKFYNVTGIFHFFRFFFTNLRYCCHEGGKIETFQIERRKRGQWAPHVSLFCLQTCI